MVNMKDAKYPAVKMESCGENSAFSNTPAAAAWQNDFYI